MQINTFPYCCGCITFSDFYDMEDDNDTTNPEELWKRIQYEVEGNSSGMYFQAWFRKCRRYDDTHEEKFEYQELLDNIVAHMPNVILFPQTVNPNTGNILQGVLWRKE